MNNYSNQLRQRLNDLNLTAYGAAHLVSAELDSDEPIKTIEQRISRYLQYDPKTLQQWTEMIHALGGTVEIRWD